jgi:hypothetical protein
MGYMRERYLKKCYNIDASEHRSKNGAKDASIIGILVFEITALASPNILVQHNETWLRRTCRYSPAGEYLKVNN